MIYADNAATTRISDSIFEKMLPFLRDQYGNASSQYSFGAKAKRAIETARTQLAAAIGAKPTEITFTSGGTEANNWILQSVVDAHTNNPLHIITTVIEHPSVLNVCRELERRGAEVTYLTVNIQGLISVESIKSAIKPHTKLVSVMLANNEIGTIQPIAEIGRFLKKHGILFHTDAVQAVGHIPVDVESLQVDFLSASAHKYGGAKGTGIMYKRAGTELFPLVFGGEQEHGLRAGTENIAGIVSAGYAIEESIEAMDETAQKIRAMRDATISGIRKRIPSVRINGNTDHGLPGIINLGFDGVFGESLMHLLDLKGICVSTGSACHSGREEPSHVILALGQTEQQAKSAIRISYGKNNTFDDVNGIIATVCDTYNKIMQSN